MTGERPREFDTELRLDRIERTLLVMDERTSGTQKRVDILERAEAQNSIVIAEIRGDVAQLKTTLDKLVWAIVGLALTVAGSAVGIAISMGAGG